ncbi:monovalent cation/H(+) antiporter subunit G [Alkalihalobacillus sp. BA299]|uniref:monovalent cation/H(+) antiporter subunit G n=1 Tax=Alkalihalobacillus sp. BA299 TaxID=2815938 RepID=UPI001FFE28C3|nr:monovalent cation/H(+) antiporter subunit G [Alkalihalobacillus sp. BA299]
MSAIEISKIVIGILILIGALLSVVSSIGLIRLPDLYNRTHAATKSATLGILAILLGAFLFFWIVDGYISARLLLGIAFVFVTAPVGGHLIGRAAYNTKVPLWEKSVQDDLKNKQKQRVEG